MATLQQMVMQPSPIGELFMSMADILGPASYTTGGFAVSPQAFGLQSFKDAIGACTVSGTYQVESRSISGPAATTIKLIWIVVSTGAEVANAVNLSAETVRIIGIGN